jgi:pimeloyl-ACP methyl ester carboxylesterase
MGDMLHGSTMLPLLFRPWAPLREEPPAGQAPRRHALGVAAERSLIHVDGVKIAVHDSDPHGAKPVLACLHAIGHGGGDFVGVERALSEHWRVVTLDWPGHGHSGSDTVPASAQRYTTLLAGVVEQLNIRELVVLGNSIGGAVAVRYATEHSDRVRAVVLVNSGGLDPGAHSLFGRLYVGTLVRRFAQGHRQEARFANWYSEYYEGLLKGEAAHHKRAEIIAAGYESAPVMVQAWDSFRKPEADLGARLGRLQMPVLVAWGKNDPVIRWARNRASVARIANAHIVLFATGHCPFLEQPDRFESELSKFLARL